MNQQLYKKLYTYWFSVLIYDHTVKFCEQWIKSWKLKEQMTGAARSGKPEIAANWLLTLCHQATYLLHKQIKALEKKHEQEGGFTEKLYRKRVEYRKENNC
ncbi:four helix bundle suffix domain-containing protein [bacterium]|nr:four helix bundle suffix domain-containing protein [bacterium]